MIYGVVAEAGAQQAAPIASLGQFDFVAGSYHWGATTLTASQVVDQTGWIGGSGLAVPASAGAGAALLYAATTTLLATCEFTCVAEVQTISGFADILVVSNSGDAFFIECAVTVGTEWDVFDNDGSFDGDGFSTDNVTAGIHKLAFNRSNTNRAISVDGSNPAAGTDTTFVDLPVIGFPMVNFFLGGWQDHTAAAINIRSISFYDLQPNSNLPGLSA